MRIAYQNGDGVQEENGEEGRDLEALLLPLAHPLRFVDAFAHIELRPGVAQASKP